MPAACGIVRCGRACGERGRRRAACEPMGAAAWVGRAGPRGGVVGRRDSALKWHARRGAFFTSLRPARKARRLAQPGAQGRAMGS